MDYPKQEDVMAKVRVPFWERKLHQAGLAHAVQGMDLDYVGVIIANDLTYKDGKVKAVKENYFDVNGILLKNKFSQEEFDNYVKHIYYVLLTRGSVESEFILRIRF